jgi:uncharacterized RDD family membrane protein YckC
MIVYTNDLTIAKWQDRFIAWLVDFVIVSVGIGISIGAVHHFDSMHAGWYATTSVIFFAYWVILEYSSGQSLGKRLLHLKTIKFDGTNPTLIDCVVNSFGKAFLLPVDVILGLIFTDKKRQRIFNRLSNTIVIKVKESDNEEIPYKLD